MVRQAFAEGANSALLLLAAGYNVRQLQDQIIDLYTDINERSVVHANAVRTVPGTDDAGAAIDADGNVDATSAVTPTSSTDDRQSDR
jgi:hypothetical protein